MLSVSSLIEFLMNLLRDEDAQAEFERDPQGMLARHGLDGMCGQDVRDVQPMLADHAAVHVKHDGYASSSHHDDDPVQEISRITQHYEVKNVSVHESNEYSVTYVDDHDTTVNVDDVIIADGDVTTIEDSYNQDNDVTTIEDSFNEDNDGVDNKDGTIEDSAVAGEDVEESLNSDDDTIVNESFNADNSENVDVSDDDVTEVGVGGSYNEDNDEVDSDVDLAGEDAA
ncbi:MAG TPA: IniB N-terminal domain-containing protein [Pseudonocardiaceae bacterium]|nr:IniB N-terminal domain-containing protein [Pseudonocardiaceae bacterium]